MPKYLFVIKPATAENFDAAVMDICDSVEELAGTILGIITGEDYDEQVSIEAPEDTLSFIDELVTEKLTDPDDETVFILGDFGEACEGVEVLIKRKD